MSAKFLKVGTPLSRQEAKKILGGGSIGSPCMTDAHCPSGQSCAVQVDGTRVCMGGAGAGTCAAKFAGGGGVCFASKEAILMVLGTGDHWCCDSCATTQWYIDLCLSH